MDSRKALQLPLLLVLLLAALLAGSAARVHDFVKEDKLCLKSSTGECDDDGGGVGVGAHNPEPPPFPPSPYPPPPRPRPPPSPSPPGPPSPPPSPPSPSPPSPPSPPRPPGPPPAPTCFPGGATVTVKSGKSEVTRRVGDLEVGDSVLTVKEDGSRVFRPIYFFGHKKPGPKFDYLELVLARRPGLPPVTEEGDAPTSRTLRLSSNHFVPVWSGDAVEESGLGKELWNRKEMRRAGEVKAGMHVWVLPAAGPAEPWRVVEVGRVRDEGAYNPFVQGGVIVVNSAVASCHSDYQLKDGSFLVEKLFGVPEGRVPRICNLVLGPLSWLYTLTGPRLLRVVSDTVDVVAVSRAVEGAMQNPSWKRSIVPFFFGTMVGGFLASLMILIISTQFRARKLKREVKED